MEKPRMPTFVDDLFDSLFGFAVACAIIVALLLTGCASVAPEAVKREAARALTKYCMTFSYEVRSGVLRPEFNTLIAPHKARVDCFGDPDNPAPVAPKAQADARQ